MAPKTYKMIPLLASKPTVSDEISEYPFKTVMIAVDGSFWRFCQYVTMRIENNNFSLPSVRRRSKIWLCWLK